MWNTGDDSEYKILNMKTTQTPTRIIFDVTGDISKGKTHIEDGDSGDRRT